MTELNVLLKVSPLDNLILNNRLIKHNMTLVARKPVLSVCNYKISGQPAHSCSLINAFVIRLLGITISRFAKTEISIFWLVSVSEQAGFNLILSETPKTGLVTSRSI